MRAKNQEFEVSRGITNIDVFFFNPNLTPESLHRSVAFQWFLTLFSALPGKARASSTHLLPHRACALTSAASSRCDHAVSFMSGLSWLCQRSRHCFPTRPGKRAASADQWPSPWMATSLFVVIF